jgi:hypothetical protein
MDASSMCTTSRKAALLALLSVGLFVHGACGGGGGGGETGGNGARDTITDVSVDGVQATFHAGALPTPHGTLAASGPSSNMAVNGGSTMVSITPSSDVVTIYVGIMGQDGYWQVAVPPGASAIDVLLTLAQTLMVHNVSITFEVADASGNVSAPVVVPTTIIQVGTGDVAVSLSWDQGINNDIDLHVVDPNGFEVYYGDPSSPEYGQLDLDSNASCADDGVNNEHVVWPAGGAPRGSYTVRVDNFENCTGKAVTYVVTVQRTGKPAQTFSGSFAASDPGDSGGAGEGVLITTFTF